LSFLRPIHKNQWFSITFKVIKHLVSIIPPMNLLSTLLSDLFRIALRLLLLAVGLVFFAGLLALLLTFAAVWGVRALWAKLTGQPVTPWVMRVDPRTGWSRFAQRGRAGPAGETVDMPDVAGAAPHAPRRFPAHHADVVDVDVKERSSP
jgi:hypothetical protein